MKIEEQMAEYRKSKLREGRKPVPDSLQGVSKNRISAVLKIIDRNTNDIIDTIYALLDNELPSYKTKLLGPPPYRKALFSDGATIAHIATHFGVLQRGGGKADREGRDYWIKPLVDIGAVEQIYFHSPTKTFIPGHPVPKSPNSCYRLSESFLQILQSSDPEYKEILDQWIKEDSLRERLELQAQMAKKSLSMVNTGHSDLIKSCINIYALKFLPSFKVLYVDDADGDRITEAERKSLAEAGIELLLQDAMPDVILWDHDRRYLWIIEAVTSDGEVDGHKVKNLVQLAKRSGIRHIGFTTAYRDWKTAAKRQGKHKNLVSGTYMWIEEDPGNNFYIKDLFRDKI